MQPYYKAMGFKQGDFPASERYYEEALTLSLYVGLTDEEQEKFWAGDFGNDYIKRNEDGKILAAKTAFFAKIISCLPGGRAFLH